MNALYDVLIIGGGPGGLAVATGLARQLYRAVVFDSGVYRNSRTKHMHNVPTWDHRDPSEFRAKARADILARYDTIAFQDTGIGSITRTAKNVFRAVDARGGVWTGRKVVLAVGVTDIFPAIEGFDEVWAHGVYHCLFCDGYEDRGAASAGVLAIDDMANVDVALHQARMARRLSDKVTIYTDGNGELAEQLAVVVQEGDGIKVDERRVVKLARPLGSGSGVMVHLGDGAVLHEGFVAHRPKSRVNGPFVSQLGLELTEQGVIKTSPPFNEASVKGVFAVGDCASMFPAVVNAMAMGAFTAGGLAGQLQSEAVPEQDD